MWRRGGRGFEGLAPRCYPAGMRWTEAMLDELRSLLGADGVLASDAALFTYEADALVLERVRPDVVVLPRSSDEVAAVVRWARAHDVPVTARGAGTGLAGGATPEHGGIVLSVNRMDKVLRVDAERQFAWVQPGLVNLSLSQQVAPLGLYYAPDPASQQVSTIGGNVATNAGGPHCLKYGVTFNHVLGDGRGAARRQRGDARRRGAGCAGFRSRCRW